MSSHRWLPVILMIEILKHTAHRPWPLPRGPWILKQVWHDLLFAHWPVAVEALRPLIPAELQIDTFGGHAWLGVVPFRMWVYGCVARLRYRAFRVSRN
jgi:uncharacterized protein YqjF (DUF2071 family)